METKKVVIQTIISTLIIVIVAALGSVFVNLGMDWYDSLNKALQWPPNVLIPIVWTVIYVSFGIINFLWIKGEKIPTKTLILMLVNGFLNILWCLVFFTLHLTFVGIVIIILNLIAGILLWLDIFKNNKIYAYILAIYPIWLSIATALNLALWILN